MTDISRINRMDLPAAIASRDANALVLLLSRAGRKIRVGRLSVVTPGGARLTFTGAAPGPAARIVFHRWRGLAAMALRGSVGLGTSYARGDWDSPDLPALIVFLAANARHGARHTLAARATRRIRNAAASLRPNTRRASRRHISFHYDIGNDFYRAWLDPGMTYSAGVFERPDMTLEQAQTAKYRRIARQLALAPGDHVLEIGCGWGGFALFAARTFGVRVTGITLSEQQLLLAQRRVAEAGLEHLVNFELRDYRDVEGTYSHIVSIEMLEAVGEAYWPGYFRALSGHLCPGGRAAVQCIVMDADAYPDYRVGSDFIQACIFPGGMLPTAEIIAEQADRAGLSLRDDARFGLHYARTLALWRENFRAAGPDLAGRGFDAYFQRLWNFYLAYCEGGFLSGRVDVGQWVFEKPSSHSALKGALP